MEELTTYIEESTIYNQSLQIKSGDLTIEIAKRKEDVTQLRHDLDILMYLTRDRKPSNLNLSSTELEQTMPEGLKF